VGAARGAWADRDHVTDLGVADVLAVHALAGVEVDLLEDVLEDRLPELDELTGLAVELPDEAVLADGHDGRTVVHVDEHAGVDVVQVESLARGVLVVPDDLAGLGPKSQRRRRVERVVLGGQPAAGRNPGLRLRDADVEEVSLGVVAAGDPGVAAAPQLERQVTPGVASRFARASDRVRTPQLFTVAGTVAGDEAARRSEERRVGKECGARRMSVEERGVSEW